MAKLTTREQFVFTLVRLRRNPSLEMLCDVDFISRKGVEFSFTLLN